ncbi:hypothetical protein PINS_up000899 [Pythium insidiosum]|nr:hypothetical protein PINS_up000899 [Pythium insidiosum]
MRTFVCVAALTVLTTSSVFAQPCDVSKVGPILQGDDMKKCNEESGLCIPRISMEDKGYRDRVPARVCESSACGKVISSILALNLPECQLTGTAGWKGGSHEIQTYLTADHIKPVLTTCGNDPSKYGPSPTLSVNASTTCSESVLGPQLVGRKDAVQSCMGLQLSELGNDATPFNSTKAVEASYCGECRNIGAPPQAFSCRLTNSLTFQQQLSLTNTYCAEVEAARNGNPGERIISQMMNSSARCPFDTKAMFGYMHPIEFFAMARNCKVSIYDPKVEKLSDADKKIYCECNQYARAALENFDLPTCKTASGGSYATFLLDAASACPMEMPPKYLNLPNKRPATTKQPTTSAPQPSTGSGSRDSSKTTRAGAANVVPTPTPSSLSASSKLLRADVMTALTSSIAVVAAVCFT